MDKISKADAKRGQPLKLVPLDKQSMLCAGWSIDMDYPGMEGSPMLVAFQESGNFVQLGLVTSGGSNGYPYIFHGLDNPKTLNFMTQFTMNHKSHWGIPIKKYQMNYHLINSFSCQVTKNFLLLGVIGLLIVMMRRL